MQEKKNEKKPRRFRIFQLKGHRLIGLLITLVMCILVLLSSFQITKMFLRVKHFEVVGISTYDHIDLINASGVKRGASLYSLDEDSIEERIMAECPYLDSVEVEIKFPNKLRFKVEGKSAQWYLDISGTKYALDGDLVVIAETEKTDGMTKLILPSIKSAIYGEVPAFGESETEIKKTVEVISAIRQTTFKTRLTEVDLESRWDIWMTVDGCYRISMGDMSDFDAKLKAVEAILDRDEVKNQGAGSIVIIKGEGGYTGAFSAD